MSGELGESGWSRTPGWIKLLLIASLSVNVAVVGLAGGSALRHWQAESERVRQPNEPGLDRRQSRILRMVPEARRDEARTILLSRQDEYEAAREAMRKAQDALIGAMRQDPFDPGRFNAVLAERREASARMWGIGYEQMGEIVQRLDAAERAEMARQLEERTRQWMKRMEQKGR
jgi:uncharacterized membrane protein